MNISSYFTLFFNKMTLNILDIRRDFIQRALQTCQNLK